MRDLLNRMLWRIGLRKYYFDPGGYLPQGLNRRYRARERTVLLSRSEFVRSDGSGGLIHWQDGPDGGSYTRISPDDLEDE